MSEYVFLFRSADEDYQEAMGTPELAQKSLERWRAWIHELEANGNLKHPGQPLERTGKIVRGKNKIVTDGPYAEAKDMVLGFIVIEARDMDDAVALASGCPIVLGGGAVEIRPVIDSPM
ncbi:MAG: YciI family protein [bacterium]